MVDEPAGRGRSQRCVKAASRDADDNTEKQLELADGHCLARRDEAEAQQRAPGEHNCSCPESIGQRSPQE